MTAAELRPYPFPYKAMMTVCSDLDETPDSARYFEIARFLNTEEETSAGKGVGLELGNTVYFDMPTDQFAYWNTDDAGRVMVRELVRSGHIDCFHSFGDLATSREHVQRALEELDKHGCRIECWVDHAAAPTNFGPDIMQGTGDIQGAPAYHADITHKHGVRYVWRGRVTSVIGQNRSRSLRGLFSFTNPLASARTIALESAKGALARVGNAKYAMHARNELLRPAMLRDGHRVFEFMRCNPYWGGVSGGATADALGDVMTGSFLRALVKRQGVCVLYTHLGKTRHPDALFSPSTIAALRQLAETAKSGDLLVTTTRKLLGFISSTRYIATKVTRDHSTESVVIDSSPLREKGMPCDLSGATFYVKNSKSARIIVDGVEVVEVQRNAADESGRESVSLPWRSLSFPQF